MSEKKVTPEEHWDSFWKEIVTFPDGNLNLEQIKKELADFSFVMEQVPKVYCHVTGNAMSYVTYKAEDVIRVADEYFNKQLEESSKDEQPQPVARWVRASDKRPEGWQLCRPTGSDKRMPLLFAPHVICDFSGRTCDPSEIEYLDESPADEQAGGQSPVNKKVNICIGWVNEEQKPSLRWSGKVRTINSSGELNERTATWFPGWEISGGRADEYVNEWFDESPVQSNEGEAVDMMCWAFAYITAWDKADNVVMLTDGSTVHVNQLYEQFKNRNNEPHAG